MRGDNGQDEGNGDEVQVGGVGPDAGVVLTLTPNDLRSAAVTATARHARAHWTTVSAIYFRVATERLHEQYGYAKPAAWAEEELGVTPSSFHEGVKMWRMVTAAIPKVAVVEWGKLSHARAALLRPVLSLGGDAREWFDLAMEAASTEDLRIAVDRKLSREVWREFSVMLPESTHELAESAMLAALHKLLPEGADETLVRERAIRHRCFEVILNAFTQPGGGGK